MPGYINLVDTASGNIAEVNANRELKIATSAEAEEAGFTRLASGDGEPLAATEDGHLLVSEDSVIFFDQIDGNAINTNLWDAAGVSGMTIAQASGFITLNNAAAVTANAYAILKSIRSFPLYPEFPTFAALDLKLNVQPQANVTIEFGFGNPSGASAITDGVFYRLSPDGTMKAVTVNNGSETVSAALTNVSINVMHDFDISVEVDDAEFEIDDAQETTIENPAGLPYAVGATRLPLFIRIINGSVAPSTAPQVALGRISVVQKILRPNKSWGEVLASMGRGSYQSPVTSFGQTANHANSTSPTSATLSNTAAGYTTLGGRFQFASPAGAATDFALFAYQVPAGYQLIVRGISIAAIDIGAAVATTATVLDWSVGLNSSAVSLATADSPPTTWAPRRVPLGLQGWEVGDGVGEFAETIRQSFDPPLIVDGGRYFHIIVQVPVGTATGSQIIRGDVLVNGYFE